jgi:signal transduction histidine kinase
VNEPHTAVAHFDAVRESVDLDYLGTEVPVSAEQALSGIDRVAEIVRALKDFAHPGADQPVPVDINHAIETAIAVSRNEWKYVAELDTRLDPNVTSVPALAGPLNQAILNIIVNASHAIADRVGEAPAEDSKGRITISTAVTNGFAEIRIADTGTGIPLAIQGRIFDPFFTTKEIGRGSGQGLAIAHGVVCEQHGGTLTFETTPDVGTTFIIRIPDVAAEVAA